jgi:cytochrome c oxidase assembly protein subunit 15
VATLLGVVGQGVLGGMRVVLDDVVLARIHGCTGPLFFGVCVVCVAVTSRWWHTPNYVHVRDSKSIAPLCWLIFLLSYLQLVLGAHLRHVAVDTEPRVFSVIAVGHIFLGITLLLHAGLLWARVVMSPTLRGCPWVVAWASILAILFVLQIALGVATWTVKYGWPTWLPAWSAFARFTVPEKSMMQANIVTAHVATGSLILISALWMGMRSLRLLRFESMRSRATTGRNVLLGVPA